MHLLKIFFFQGLIYIISLVLDLGKTVKEAVKKQGMLAWQYNTIGVSDAVTMGGEGGWWHLIGEAYIAHTYS